MSKAASATIWGVLGGTTLFILWCLWSLLWPCTPITYHRNPIPVLNVDKTVQAGESLLLDQDFTKWVDSSVRVTRVLKNGLVYTLPPLSARLPAGRHHFTSATTTIPEELPGGVYTMEMTFAYRINLLRTEVFTISTEPFLVKALQTDLQRQAAAAIEKQHEVLKRLAKVEKYEKTEKHTKGEKGDKGDPGPGFWGKK